MYFREKKSPSGKVLQLIEAYRDLNSKPRQRVVVSLGNASMPEETRKEVASAVSKHFYDLHGELFPPDYKQETQLWIDKIVKRVDREGRWRPFQKSLPEPSMEKDALEVVDGVLVDKIKHTNTTPLGPSLLGLHAWKSLGMEKILKESGFNNAQCDAAALSIINRLVDPVSEYRLSKNSGQSALSDLLGCELTSKDRYYRVSDKLLAKKEIIEKSLRATEGKLFNLDQSILLYDLTNSHFEGNSLKNPKAKRGKNKQKRNDCPQIVVGMVFNRDGFSIAHKVFEGSKNDSKSLPEMIAELQTMLQKDIPLIKERVIVIVDAGIATKTNLSLLKSLGFSYLVNDSRRRREKYREQFARDEHFFEIAGRENKTKVKICQITDPFFIPQSEEGKDKEQADELLLCKSEGRKDKENAIRSKAEEKYINSLTRLKNRVEKGQLKDPAKIERAIGKLQKQHSRVQQYYIVKIEAIVSPEQKKNSSKKTKKSPAHKVVWAYKDGELDEELLGCYVLRTDRKNLSAEEIWKLYITLTKAEAGFRALKSDLGLRPNYHQTENRVDAHVFITVIAYHLQRFLLYTLENAGDNRSWETIKRLLGTHSYTTIIVPTKDQKIYRLRKAGEPEELQKAVYRTLGVEWKNLPSKKIVIGERNRP